MRAKTDAKQKARQLRREGKSLREIAEEVGASKASVSVWVRDVVLSDEHRDALDRRRPNVRAAAEWQRRRAAARRSSSRARGRQRGEDAQTSDWLYVAGLMLYWGEGSKSNNSLVLTNSDPDLVRLWMRFLREALRLSDDRIRLRVYIYEDHDPADAERHWLEVLELTHEQLSKTVVKTSWSGKTQRRLPHGTAAVSVHSTDLVEEVLGALEALGDFRRDEWRSRTRRNPRSDGASATGD